MSDNPNVRFKVSNFGPVKEGEFELKPLTIFIGPNNSGKSYMATLVYAIAKVLSSSSVDDFLTDRFIGSYSELKTWLSTVFNSTSKELPAMPEEIRLLLQQALDEQATKVEKQLAATLLEYFGDNDLNNLRRADAGREALSVVILSDKEAEPLLAVHLTPTDQEAITEIRRPNAEFVYGKRMRDLARLWFAADPSISDVWGSELALALISNSWERLLRQGGILRSSPYYLPSARSGILQAWPLFAYQGLQALRIGGALERARYPRLQGVTGDFLEELIGRLAVRVPPLSEKMGSAIQLLEGRLFRGEIALSYDSPEPLAMLYRAGNVQIAVQKASSMVAELAPLDLWLKYIVEPTDLLIIDEPEAHLHPENQRLIARVLVRLIRAGVRIICPTHNATILHQISNLILAAQLDEAERKLLSPDLTADDMISMDEIGVYWFDLQEDGAHIKEVPIDNEFGISEDMFVRVSEEIGEETYKLSLAVIGENGLG